VITFEQFNRNLKAAEVREYFQTLGFLEMMLVLLGISFWKRWMIGSEWEFFFLRRRFQQGLDVWDAWSFFKLLDEDGGGEVEIEDSGICLYIFLWCMDSTFSVLKNT